MDDGKRWQMVCIYLHNCQLHRLLTYQGISSYTPRKNEHGSWTSTVWKGKKKQQQIPNLPSFGFLDENGKPHIAIAQVVSEERIRELCDEDGCVLVEGGRWQGYLRGSMKWGDRISSDDLMFSRFSHASFAWMFQTNLVICWCCLNCFDGPKVFGHSQFEKHLDGEVNHLLQQSQSPRKECTTIRTWAMILVMFTVILFQWSFSF